MPVDPQGLCQLHSGPEAATIYLPLPQMETIKQGVDQTLVEGQEKLHQMWLGWNQKQLQGPEENAAKPEVTTRGGTGCLGPWLASPHAFPSLSSH